MLNRIERKSLEIGEIISGNRFLILLSGLAAILLLYLLLSFNLESEGMRSIIEMLPGALNAVTGLGITVLITTFSFVFVALSLVSMQFSPRVVRHFWHGDIFRRTFLWSYISIFGACFILQFLPHPRIQLLGVMLGFYLIFILFPIFLGYLADNLNAASITNSVARITLQEIERSHGILDSGRAADAPSYLIRSAGKGFLESIDHRRLIDIFSAVKKDHPGISLRIGNYIGSFIENSSILAEIEPHTDIGKEASGEIARCFRLSKFRSLDHDIEHGIRQLEDIAIKAISPAVNDPTTCVNSLHYLGTIIKSLAARDESSAKAKELAKYSIILKEPSFEKYVDDAFTQIYQWGRGDYVIVKTIINILADIIPEAADEKKFGAIIHEIEEMELDYLYDPSKSQPIALKEHRNALRKSLTAFYKTVSKKAESLSLPDEVKKTAAILEKLQRN